MMSDWISIEDRLPEDGQEILAWDGTVNLANYSERNKGRRYEWDCDTYCVVHVTHWMPLSKPPKVNE